MNRNPKRGTTQFLFLALFCSLLLSFTPSSSIRGQGADRASAASPDKLGPGRFIPPEGKPEAVNIEAPAAAPGCQLFDFESGDQGFTVQEVFGTPALWHVSDVCRANLAGHSATHTFYYGDDTNCNYNTGARNAANLISPNIGVAGVQTISFNYLVFVEGGGFDSTNVDYSTDNGVSWTNFLTKANFINDNQWHNISVNVSAILANASSLRLRFRFDSVDNIANSTTGWHIDDLQVCGGGPPVRPWTTEGSVGTIDTASASIAVLNDFGFTLGTSAVPGASKGGTAIARYNITAVDGISAFCPATQSNVSVRFRNQDNSGATSRVSFTINARSMATGAKSTIFTFSSNGISVPGQQSTLATFAPAIDFDFAHNTYWIEATVFASKPQQPNLSPTLQSVQIWESVGTPCQ